MDAALDSLEAAITELEKCGDCADSLNGLQYASWNSSIAFAGASIYFAYLRTLGVDTPGSEQHPIMQEVARIKSSINKVKEVEEMHKLESSGKRLRIDTGAAERMIRFHLAPDEEVDTGLEETKRFHEVVEAPPKLKKLKTAPI
eukprot:GHVO01005152.1.p1 GENE.GHVO01005152.1~~GHVO01005152.1.p1  ORF type:complete len:144 (+),score=21.12 GHVO01005152.1:114-545(+)